MRAPHRQEVRELAIRWYEQGCGTYEEGAEFFKVGSATLKRWVHIYRVSQRTAPLPKGGRVVPPKLNAEWLEEIRKMLLENPAVTALEVRALIAERGGPVVSASTVKRAFNTLKFTRKKTVPMWQRSIQTL